MTTFRNSGPYVAELFRIGHELDDMGLEEQADKVLEAARKIAGTTLFGSFPSQALLENIQLLLKDQRIEFAVIGGVAVTVRGYPRATEDIDFLVSKLPEKSEANNADYMRSFGLYKSRSSTGTVQGFEPRQGDGYAETLLVQTELDRYALNTATEELVLGLHVPVVSPKALILLKARALTANQSRRARDGADITAVWESSGKPSLDDVVHLLNENELTYLREVGIL